MGILFLPSISLKFDILIRFDTQKGLNTKNSKKSIFILGHINKMINLTWTHL